VEIDDRAHKPNDNTIIQGDYKAMTRIVEKFLSRRFYDWIVKYILGDIAEVLRISRTEKFDFKHRAEIGNW
jgi:hypothetical protein